MMSLKLKNTTTDLCLIPARLILLRLRMIPLKLMW